MQEPMPKVIFLHKDGRKTEAEVPEDWSVMQAAREYGVDEIEGACGGALACATCHCYVHPDWESKVLGQDNEKTEEEEDMLDLAFDVRETSRLGCQIKLNDALDGLVVALPGTKTDW